MSPWVWVGVAFLAGGGVGWLLAHASVRRHPTVRRLRRLQAVLDRFQGEVEQHFQESGELITRLRSDVESLYRHLESGAARLTTEEAAQTRLRELQDEAAEGEDHGRASGA